MWNKIYNPNKDTWSEILKRKTQSVADIEETVLNVFKEVDIEGDIAIDRYTQKFDKVTLDSVLVTDEEIQKTLERRKIVYEKIENIPKTVADILSRGEIIARFNGKMEFGERALGNRSILADPRAENIKDKINSIIKSKQSKCWRYLYRTWTWCFIY